MAVRSLDQENDELALDIESVCPDSSEFNMAYDPATDLDSFVNSRWRDSAEIPPGYACWDNFAALRETTLKQQLEIALESAEAVSTDESRVVGDFWTAAMNISGANDQPESLHRELQRIDALDDVASTAAYIRDVHANGQDLLFTLEAQPDYRDPHWMIAYVYPGGPGLPDRELYFPDTQAGVALLRDYRDHVATMLELSGADTTGIGELAEQIIGLEARLARASVSRRELARNVALRYNPLSVADADRLHPAFCWRRFFSSQHLFPERFSLAIPAFHVELGVMLRELPAATWRAYLRYRQFDDAAPCLGGVPSHVHARFHWQRLRGARSPMPRWKQALISLNQQVGEAMGKLYAGKFCREPIQAEIRNMIENMRAAMRNRIETVDWMTPATKRAATDKLERMRAQIGKPSHWRDWSGLAIGRDNWYENVREAQKFNRRWLVGLLNRPVDHRQWSMTPQTVNARYDPLRNEVVVPAALLQAPLFDSRADVAVNYGRLGAIIAHEMTHGFDDQGSRFGPDGRFENWWTDADRANFETRARRLADAVSESTVSDEPIDGNLTLGENIADLGGLAVAADALQGWIAACAKPDPMIAGYTRMQWLFFCWAALWRQKMAAPESRLRRTMDTHAPGPLRANLAASENRRFHEAFASEPARPATQAGLGIW